MTSKQNSSSHQFNIGDLVYYTQSDCRMLGPQPMPLGIVVAIKGKSLSIYFTDTGEIADDIWDCELELVPHPDTVRLDWLTDPNNHIGNVQLPSHCVENNIHSLRDAIDCAMELSNTETDGHTDQTST